MTTNINHQKIHKLKSLLKYTFVVVPIAAGLDKFLNLLVDWEIYMHPSLSNILPFSPSGFMMVVGVIEIAAGFIVLKWTKTGAYIVSAWLLLIALTLLFSGQYLDVAVRDIVMSVSAFVLAGLADIESGESTSNNT